MVSSIIHRLLFSIVVLIAISMVIFVIARVVPVSPAIIVLGPEASAEQIEAFENRYGLDQPLLAQYGHWIGEIFERGDFGRSYITNMPISQIIAETLPITLRLVLLGFLFSVSIAIPLGIISAYYPNSVFDHACRIFAVAGVSIPGFWLGLMLIVYVAVKFGWFSPGGYIPPEAGLGPHINSMVLPAFSLGIYYTAILSRMMRSSLIEVLTQDYIRTARAMGLGRFTILWYALKNALPPVVTVGAMSIGYMFGWALVIEQVFNIAGLSRALLTAIFQRDYFVIQAVVLVFTAAFILANLCADVLHRVLNPKVDTISL